jgi:5-hydroxyisourate hydrolase
MAVISTHTLDAVQGTHAGGIKVTLARLEDSGRRTVIFCKQTDPGGRLLEEIASEAVDVSAQYELVFETGPYFAAQLPDRDARQIVSEIVLRFTMPDATAKYHLPVILSPNGYSVWWSS